MEATRFHYESSSIAYLETNEKRKKTVRKQLEKFFVSRIVGF